MTLFNSAIRLYIVVPRRKTAGREVIISKSLSPTVIFSRLLVSTLFCILLVQFALGGAVASEFRGAWVTAWDKGFLTPAQANATVAAAKAAHMNALFIQVRKVGDAYYSSDYEPRATNISGPSDYDPLQYIVERAHREGIEVHAWINTLRVQSVSGASSAPDQVCNAHPDWLTCDAAGRVKTADGLFLDPGVPAVQDYTVWVAADIVSKYNVDGIHLDYVRYPGSKVGYNSEAVGRFNSRFGRTGLPASNDPQWLQWRRDQVTALVRRIYSETNAIRPDVKVSAAAICWGDRPARFDQSDAYRETLQDWAGWMREGILDAVVPMNYRSERTASSAAQYRGWLKGMLQWQGDRHVYAGQIIRDDVSGAVAQLRASRAAGTDGEVCFAFNDTPARAELVAALKRTVYAENASVPSMSWKQRFARAPGHVTRVEN